SRKLRLILSLSHLWVHQTSSFHWSSLVRGCTVFLLSLDVIISTLASSSLNLTRALFAVDLVLRSLRQRIWPFSYGNIVLLCKIFVVVTYTLPAFMISCALHF